MLFPQSPLLILLCILALGALPPQTRNKRPVGRLEGADGDNPIEDSVLEDPMSCRQI